MSVCFTINGWLNQIHDYENIWICLLYHRQLYLDHIRIHTTAEDTDVTSQPRIPGICEYSEIFTLKWETEHLLNFGNGLTEMTSNEIKSQLITAGLTHTILAGVMSAIIWPSILLKVADVIDNPCNNT
jgi:hypothetical protein